MKLRAACLLLSLMLEVTNSFILSQGNTKALSSLSRSRSSLSSQSTNITSGTASYDREEENEGDANEHSLLPSASDMQLRGAEQFYSVPVIGPLSEGPPLLLGADLVLNSPTPIQWKTIQECVEIHSQAGNNFELTSANLEAAPLVAVLDGDQSDGCYATLAAIVCVTANEVDLDTNDADSFRDSLARIGLGTTIGTVYSGDSKIRLLGIGRAKLSHFEKLDTDQGPVVARMDLLQDEPQSGDTNTSSVHVVYEMATWASRIGSMHQDLRAITQGLQAVYVRSQMAEDLQDYDGIGDLFFKEQGNQSNLQQQKEERTIKELQDKIDAMLATFVQTEQSKPLSEASARLLKLENFGLGNSPESLGKLEPITSALIERLQPYYSPTLLSSEEFYYGVYSFVALTSLQSYLDRSHLTWALRSEDTVDRLKQVYEWMDEHKRLLQEVAELKNQELKALLSLSSESTTIMSGTAPYDNEEVDKGDAEEDSLSLSGSNTEMQPAEHFATVPVIVPLSDGPPLLLGADLFLNPPTTIQWKTIQECVEIHSLARENLNLTTTDLDAAPVVAILDGNNTDGCYATLAAIVGVTGANKVDLDTDDADSFRDSLARIGVGATSGKAYSADSKIRLLGIGRAKLTHFEKLDTGEGPVLMARVDLLQDEPMSGEIKMSPAQVISEMALWASRIGSMHQDLRKITQRLQAANVQLQMASENWEDHDGIGDLVFKEQVNQNNKQQQKEERMTKEIQDKIDTTLAAFVQTGQSRPLSKAGARLLKLENFGLGNSPASLGKLEPIATVLIERLQPYYSPTMLSSEEFYYGVFSFVALKSLESYLDRSHLTWALRSEDTVDRLKQVYGWMEEHRRLLQEVADSKSRELSDCGVKYHI